MPRPQHAGKALKPPSPSTAGLFVAPPVAEKEPPTFFKSVAIPTEAILKLDDTNDDYIDEAHECMLLPCCKHKCSFQRHGSLTGGNNTQARR
jgi:hypothetical protein